MTHSRTPDLMPVLSRGKHRNPRKGACFMELASYLAGERWSDHPACTHPVLAAMARDINDYVADGSRSQLAVLIPDVIGLTTEDPRADAWIAREAALTALPITSAERQGVSAVGLLRCERVLNEFDGLPADHLSPRSAAALDDVPMARDWARSFSGMGWGSPGSFARRSAPAIVHSTVSGIAASPMVEPDTTLIALLKHTIELCHEWFRHAPVEVAPERWSEAARMTRR
jgi:hypothetical protein